jgi:radical SAM protein with 4Fe4S-binding SPASM domain
MSAQQATRRKPQYLPFSLCSKILNEAASIGLQRIFISGGEPMLNPDANRVIEAAVERGIFPYVSTNGLLVTEEFLDILSLPEVGFVQVSFDTADKHEFALITGKQHIFGRVAHNIKKIVQRGIDVRIKTVVTRLNCTNIGPTIAFLDALGVSEIELVAASPSASGRDGLSNLMLTDKEFAKIQEQIAVHWNHATVHFSNPLAKDLGKKTPKMCGGGIESLVVFPDGDVGICSMLRDSRFVFGNAHNKSLHNIWMCDALARFRRLDGVQLREPCINCTSLETCRTGCFSISKALFDDPFHPFPTC